MSEDFQMDTLENLTARAVSLLQAYEPKDRPYWGCFSGGKDSVVIKELARMAGVRVVWHYNITTIDPPELTRFILHEHPDVEWMRPKESFWSMAKKKGFPTRMRRWCCAKLKESTTPKDNTAILGVRTAESVGRSKRWASCDPMFRNGVIEFAPILGWKTHDVWNFIRGTGIKYCSLYDEGFERLGCVGCPMAGEHGRKKEFVRWPQFERMWKNLFRDLWERKAGTIDRNGNEWFGSRHFTSWEACFEWWLSDQCAPRKQSEQFDWS